MTPTSSLSDLLRGNASTSTQRRAAETLMRLLDHDLDAECPLCHELAVMGADHLGGCPIREAREMAG